MVRSTWDALTAGLPEDDLRLFARFRSICCALPDVEERVHKTEVAFAVERVFASGFMKSHRLEIAVDLLRVADHPALRDAFHTTNQVVTHRFTIESTSDLDSLKDLIVEAHDTVGPGTG